MVTDTKAAAFEFDKASGDQGSVEAIQVEPSSSSIPTQRWFSLNGCVVRRGRYRELLVGGTLIGRYTEHDLAERNMLLALLCQAPQLMRKNLAEAFEVSTETLRQICRRYETGGMPAVMNRGRGGRPPKATGAMIRRIEKLFEQGLSISVVQRRLKGTVSRSLVGKLHKRWARGRVPSAQINPAQQALPLVLAPQPADVASPATTPIKPPAAPSEETPTPSDAIGSSADARVEATSSATPTLPVGPVKRPVAPPEEESKPRSESEACGPIRAPSTGTTSEYSARAPVAEDQIGSPEEDEGANEKIDVAEPRSRRSVREAGGWLMVAMVADQGFYTRAMALCKKPISALRIAFDAFIIALTSGGEIAVEGVRRLATSTAAALLISTGAPSATWIRRVVGSYCGEGVAENLHFGLAGDLMREALKRAEDGRPVVFYIDNHMRPYTGKQRLRWGWRMQDKRSRPGNSDYYVHDEDGRPVMRITVPEHGSLASFLLPIAAFLRAALGRDERILVAFDRGGAFPEAMVDLRNAGIEFVTYERAPYRKLSKEQFKQEGKRVELRGSDENTEIIYVIDSRKNLKKGRGRVRRLHLLMPDNRQVNLLATSEEDAEFLIAVMSGRWCQENGFKHGVERWGINQLDGRKAREYSPDTVIPNPARRRLDRALRLARLREGEARRGLAHSKPNTPEWSEIERDLKDALTEQAKLEAQRPGIPEHIKLQDSELAGKLVYIAPEYKMVLDTIRIACANSESELAAELAPHLLKPEEAKRALRNLFSASGDIRVNRRSITILLDPAGTRNERAAIGKLLASVNRRRLRHPGDPHRRPLCFRLITSQVA